MGACQSSQLKNFEQVSPNQEKDTVLEHVGNPTFKDRIKGQDRWTYVFYDNDKKYQKEIYFENGFVTYVGDPVPSFISAEQQDEINAEQERELSKMKWSQPKKQK